MEFAGLKIAALQLRNAAVVLYSVFIAATSIPEFGRISNALIIPYYLFIPGYFVTLVLRQGGTLLEKLFFSVAWSLAIVASVYSALSLSGGPALSESILVPLLTVLLMAYDYYRKK